MTGIRLPTSEKQGRVEAHWAEVRAGLHTPASEPDWKQGKSVAAEETDNE